MGWRTLSAPEIEQLEKQLNSANDWNLVSVVDTFNIGNIRRTHFAGRVFIGDDVVLSNVGAISNYRLEDECMIQNVSELSYSGYSFDFPVEVRNEDGSYTITACPELIVTDAFLVTHSERNSLLRTMGTTAGSYASMPCGVVGRNVKIQNVKALRNVFLGEYAEISDSTLLENVMVHSSKEEPTIIGAGVVVRNAIVGLQNTIDANVIIRNVVTGSHVSLTDGLRLSHAVVGDNSHLACCEILHALIFPFHEQHHNNSFLIASLVQGQSNVAAGATLGSNHNGRKNDCEMVAERGFWPGLCVSVKFPSYFAAYTLLAKGDYPYEICLTLPFCLLNNNVHDDVLEVMPAYWWMYNTYALRRNAEKYRERDVRKTKVQHIHFQPLAPDTVQEIMRAMNLMIMDERALTEGIERSKRKVRMLKKTEAYAAYREMLLYYAVSTLQSEYGKDAAQLFGAVKNAALMGWTNVGGQLMLEQDLAQLMQNSLPDWTSMHAQYDTLWDNYDGQNKEYAAYVLKYLCDGKPSKEKIEMLFEEGLEVIRNFDLRADAERERDLKNRR